MDALDSIVQHIDKFASTDFESHPFYHFEPWDIGHRTASIIEQARKDGIDLYNPEIVEHIGLDPHPFQTGFMMSDAFISAMLSGSQVGKSFAVMFKAIIMLTGEIPISMRHKAGVDTGVKRKITQGNIQRYGRINKHTGQSIDHDITVMKGMGSEWDCGNIMGIGLFPAHMIAPENSKIWIGTFMKAMNEYWWPRLTDSLYNIIPEHLIDKSKGVNGIDSKNNTINLVRNCKIPIITYESGYQRYEAEMVWGLVLDEEPPDVRVWQAGQQHCHYLMPAFTPYNGITYTKDILFPKRKSKDINVFHATQYDSPYQTERMINIRRASMEQYDIGSRIWGLHTESSGKPYFDRQKITSWLRRYGNITYEKSEFVPSKPFFGTIKHEHSSLDGLMDVNVIRRPCTSARTEWRIYEDVKENVAYLYTADTSEGAIEVKDAGDFNAGYITRAITPEERQKDKTLTDEILFKICASVRTSIETEDFTRESLMACKYYNNALMCAETRRGASNATFLMVAKDYPYWYKHVSINEASRTQKEHIGWDTNSATRGAIFDLVRDYIGSFSEDEYPHIPDVDLLKELIQAICGKNGRCDHPKNGSLDNTMAYGISFYVWKNTPEQVIFNGEYVEKEKKTNRRQVAKQNKSIMPNMGYRHE